MSALGGKAASLEALRDAGLPTPAFCVVPGQWLASRPDVAAIAEWLDEHVPPGHRFAVRSSANVEDGEEHSFAGQFATRLNVLRDDLADAVHEVWVSGASPHAMAYAERAGIAAGDVQMNVIVQRMVAAEVSGVVFAVDPVAGRTDVAVVSAAWGLGEGLVSGDLDADRYDVGLAGEVQCTLAQKSERVVSLAAGGTASRPVGEHEITRRCLSDGQVRTLAEWARDLSARAGSWQDVEWCLADGELWLLQSRPITGLVAAAGPAARVVWDNSNIVESYPGVTTPLTFSFVRHVYGSVYPLFFRFMGVEPRVLAAHAGVFEMLGLVNGRIYYNLLNWHRALSLLPGYAVNARFMEDMMGVTDTCSAPLAVGGNKWVRLARAGVGIVRSWFRLDRDVADFHHLVDEVLAELTEDSLARADAASLAAYYDALERRLIARWQPPLVNDFFAMVFFGLLRKLLARWCPDLAAERQNELLIASQSIVSTEPIRRLHELVDACRDEPELVEIARRNDAQAFVAALTCHRGVAGRFDALRVRFGARTIGELKLETVTARQDPTILAQQVMAYLNMPRVTEPAHDPAARRIAAELEVRERVGWVKYGILRWLLGHTRRLVAGRENLRFERTRVFDAARSIFLALGSGLTRIGALRDDRDVFWLTKDELLDYSRGTAVDTELDAIVTRRKAAWARHRRSEMPDRFVSFGSPYPNAMSTTPAVPVEAAETMATGGLRGTGCCAGRVTGEVLVVRDPSEVTEIAGKILVAERTDPGWTPLFPLAAGILVERGSLLSHSAIVARELAIPAVVAIPGLTKVLTSGDRVTLDGSTGEVVMERRGAASSALEEAFETACEGTRDGASA
jgi:pyruvate,water dikinase